MNISYIIDGHFDILSDVCIRRKNGERNVMKRLYLPSFRAGHVTGVVASLFVDSCYLPYGALEQAMEQISALYCELEESPEDFMLCTKARDFDIAASAGKIGILMSFEGAEPVSSCQMLHGFYAAGVRGLGLAWSRRNQAADGCDFSGTQKKGGLTPYGLDLIREAEQLSMMIDISHLSDEGVEDVLNHTSCPIAATHSNSRSIADRRRNLTDSQLKELAKRGGIVGLNSCSLLASSQNTCDRTSLSATQLLKHLDQMISIMGDAHIGFGFDFCDQFLTNSSKQDLTAMPCFPFDLLHGHEEIPAFLNLMKQHGYEKERIAKIAGENWIQFFKQTLRN